MSRRAHLFSQTKKAALRAAFFLNNNAKSETLLKNPQPDYAELASNSQLGLTIETRQTFAAFGGSMDIHKIASQAKLLGALIALSAMLAFGFVPRAYADDDRTECQHRIKKAEAKLDAAVRKHGKNSAKTRARRTELRAQRERCYNRVRAWWDNHEQKWHEDRDWDHDDRH